MNKQNETEIEFPLNFEIEEPETKISFQVKKLVRFFNYVENWHNSKVNAKGSDDHIYLFIRDAEISIDYDNTITIRAPSLEIEIYVNKQSREIKIHGDAFGFEFKIEFQGKIRIRARENRVMLMFKVKSIPKITRK